MQKRALTFCIIGLLLPFSSRAQFEGSIGMKVTMPEDDTVRQVSYRLFVRADMLMTEISGNSDSTEEGKFIFRGDRQILWIVNDREKDYLEISLKDTSGNRRRETSADSGAQQHAPLLRKTGNTTSILGYPCSEYVVDEGGRQFRIWGTTRLGDVYEGLQKSFGKMGGDELIDGGRGWEDELASSKIFPLKIVTTKNGKQEETQEVTSIEPSKMAPSTFEPPKEYTRQAMEFDMNKLIQSMQEKMNEERYGEEDSTGVKQ